LAVQDLIKTAQDLMKVYLYTIDAFPTGSQQEEWVQDVWAAANARESVNYEITSDIHKLVSMCLILIYTHANICLI
jgi:endonuclease I